LTLSSVDSLCPEALDLLREAALEARALYPELFAADAPMPTNEPLAPRGVYIVAQQGSRAIGMGAIRPLDGTTAEVRRMFVTRDARGSGVAAAVLAHLEEHAAEQGFTRLVLETGHRQAPAMRLYERSGFSRIEPFGPYVGDPVSVCFAKPLTSSPTKRD
jgi:GNAT superfamily N-acetyltransferase